MHTLCDNNYERVPNIAERIRPNNSEKYYAKGSRSCSLRPSGSASHLCLLRLAIYVSPE